MEKISSIGQLEWLRNELGSRIWFQTDGVNRLFRNMNIWVGDNIWPAVGFSLMKFPDSPFMRECDNVDEHRGKPHVVHIAI